MDWKENFSKGAREKKDLKALKYFNKNSFEVRKKYLNSAIRNKNKLILDLGCGDGQIVEDINRSNKIIGIDFVPEFLKKAKFETIEGDVNNLPFKKEKFDVVLGVNLFQYLDDKEGVIDESYRVLKKGGKIYINILNRSCITSSIILIFKKNKESRKNLKELKELVSRKFKIVNYGYIPVLPGKISQKLLGWLFKNKFLAYDVYVVGEK